LVIDSIDLSFALTQGSNPTTLADQDFVLTVEGGPYTIIPPNTGSLVDLCVVGSSPTSPPPIPCPNGLFVPLNLLIGSQTFWLVDTSTTPLPALNFDYDTNNDGVIESPALVPTVLDQALIDDGGGSTPGCGVGGSDRVYPAPNIFPTPTPLCQVQVLDPINPSSSYANGAIVFRDDNGVLQTAELAGGVNPDGSCGTATTVPPGTPANLLTVCNSTNPVYNGSPPNPGGVNVITVPPAVTLSPTLPTLTVPLNSTAVANIDLVRSDTFSSGDLNLLVTGLPNNAGIPNFSPNPVVGTGVLSTLSIPIPNNTNTLIPRTVKIAGTTVTPNAALVTPGSFQLTVTGPTSLTQLDSSVTLSISPLAQKKRFRQTVTITNTSGKTLVGPIYLAVGGLVAGQSATQVDLTTARSSVQGSSPAPLGELLAIGATLAANATAKVTVEFDNASISALAPVYSVLAADLSDITSGTSKAPSALSQKTFARQTITVKNISAGALTGPFYLSTEGLTPGAVLTTQTTTAPAGFPLVGLVVTGNSLAAGATTSGLLEFDTSALLTSLQSTPHFYSAPSGLRSIPKKKLHQQKLVKTQH
jgi:hypothetical protein